MTRQLFQEPGAGPMPYRGWRTLPVSLALHGLAALGAASLLGQPAATAAPEGRRRPVTWVRDQTSTVPLAAASRPRPVARVLPAVPERPPAPAAFPIDPAPLAASEESGFDTTPASCLGACNSGPAAGEGDGSGAPGVAEGGAGDAAGGVRTPQAVGGNLRPPRKLRHVQPQYPEPARRAGLGGVVVVRCVIDVAGRVADAHVVSGHPLLEAAALAAVREWRYAPTLLNDVPVPVLMTVSVTFVAAR